MAKSIISGRIIDVSFDPYPIVADAAEMVVGLKASRGEGVRHPRYLRREPDVHDQWIRAFDPGYTYILRCDATGLVKIGKAKDPVERVRAIQAMSPTPLRAVALLAGGTAERNLHGICWPAHEHGEWFRLDDTAILGVLWGGEMAAFTRGFVLHERFAAENAAALQWRPCPEFSRG